jgi:hypothetical protein
VVGLHEGQCDVRQLVEVVVLDHAQRAARPAGIQHDLEPAQAPGAEFELRAPGLGAALLFRVVGGLPPVLAAAGCDALLQQAYELAAEVGKVDEDALVGLDGREAVFGDFQAPQEEQIDVAGQIDSQHLRSRARIDGPSRVLLHAPKRPGSWLQAALAL